MTPSALRTSFARCATSFRACSTPAAGAWPRWGRWRSSRPPTSLRSPRSPEQNSSERSPGAVAARSGRYGAGVREQLLEFAALVHLDGDIATPDEFAVDIELREGRPIRIGLQRFADFRILEDIDVRKLRLAGSQRTDRLRRKSALRKIGRALHIEHHRRGRQLVLDPFNSIHRHSPN